MKASDEIRERQIKADKPFCWQSKAAMKTIADIFDATRNTASARSVYVALSEIQSDEKRESFTRTIAQIASRAGVSYRTTTTILNCFEEANFIAVKRNTIAGTKLQAPSTYTLLGNHCLTIGNGKLNPLPRLKKNRKNRNNDDDTRALARTRAKPARQRANGSSIESDVSLEEAEKHPLWPEFVAYCESKGGRPSPKGFFNTWLPKQSKARVAKAFGQDRDKILAQRHDLVSRHCNGALTTDDRVHNFKRFAPPEVQQKYDSLGALLKIQPITK